MIDVEELIKELRKEEVLHEWYDFSEKLKFPDWRHTSKVHDWRNHIPKSVRNKWDDLLLETKVIAYAMAEEIASEEEWD